MSSLPRHRPAVPLICALALCLAGCAISRPSRSAQPAAPPPLHRATVDSLTDAPETSPPDHLYRLVRHAFLETQANHLPAAITSLDSATVRLSVLLKDPESAISRQRLASLTRVVMELYRDLLPPVVPLSPKSPLAHLLETLPEDVAKAVAYHPYHQEFWIRKLAGTSDVPIDYMPEVLEYIQFFQTEGRGFFTRWLARSSMYLDMIKAIFQEAGLPQDLAYKAMIESGFNPRAYSRARAVGLWQFVGGTGRLYGLRRNNWIDERRDPEKATRAAARHLRHLHTLFDDWRLVVAAYNCGQGRLDQAIRKSGTRNFWNIDALPRETRQHLPKFMAVVLISKAPEWFGFDAVSYLPPLEYDRVPVSEPVSLRLAAQCTGSTYEWLKELNPELRRGYTPPSTRRKVYPLRVPVGTAEKFKENYARVPAHRKIQMVDYTVRYGDTVSEIAQNLGVSVRAILDANNIKNPRRVRAGRRLTIPIRPERYARLKLWSTRQVDAAPDPSQHQKVTYTVRRGDTLWDIARKAGVTLTQIRAWNGLKSTGHIHPGNRLVIWKPKNPSIEVADSDAEAIASTEFYTIRHGDTLWDIARMFNTSVAELKSRNNIRKASRIRPGTRLRVRAASEGAEAD